MPPRLAHLDRSLTATVVSRRPLLYRAGPDASVDRPAYVRAGSSLSWLDDRLALVQDDANFIALVDPRTGLAEAITLPAGKHGLRQFDDARGNKKFKLDLEACCVVAGAEGPQFIALGSGSKKRRRHVVILDAWHESAPRISLVDADALYLALEGAARFAGSDMNIEGALALPHAIRLFGRGNGKVHEGRVPLNATCDLPLASLLAYFAAPDDTRAPTPTSITQYDLGSLDGLPLGFTDAALLGDTVVYTAAAEDSSDASDDGPVTGSVIGVVPATGELRYAPLTGPSGAAMRDKIEGVVPVPDSSDRVYVVIDPDDATRPSELCEVRLGGDWR
jgi:hypothetical protein